MRGISILLVFLTSGCGDDDDPGRDAGTDAPAGEDAGSNPEGCVEPDRTCPDDQPVPGAPCEGDLQCEYADPNGYDTWIYDCRDGAWLADLNGCQLDGCPIPPLGEMCLEPFEGTIEGAVVEIGPPDSTQPFDTFEDGEEVPLIIGAQGGAMVAFRIRVQGAQTPDCVGLTIRVTADSEEAVPQQRRVTLHCGMSLPVFAVLPEQCEPATVTVDLEVELDGVGTGEARVQFTTEGECFG